MLDKLRMGTIMTSHGIKGEAKVYPLTDDLDRFKFVKSCSLISEKEDIKIDTELISFRKTNKALLCKFKDINTPEEVAKIRNFSIYVDRNSLPKLKENENYIGDLIGLEVISEDNINLGKVKNIFETGANKVMEVETKDNKIVLFPYISQCILEVNLKEKYILVHILDGLLDI